ncbi:immunity 49 family protein [Streptomyces sp. NPDC001118]
MVDAANSLASYALGAHEDGLGRLSPRLYWWHRGHLTSLTVIADDNRTFSIQPPPDLLGLMKGLVGLDRAGRLATCTQAQTPDIDELEHTMAESVSRLPQEPDGLRDTFGFAVALAHARCATDPKAADADTWGPWALAVQLGSALFTGAEPQELWLREGCVRLPAVPADPSADARAWLDDFYVALVCRQQRRLDQLAQVPLETLRQDESVDEYVLHWIDTLQSYGSQRPMNDLVDKLRTTMETSDPTNVTHSPTDFVNCIDYQPVALFHRLLTGEAEAFNTALDEALAHHGAYWGDSTVPRARVPLGPLAMACMAYDYGFPVDTERPYLPKYLLNGQRIETIPG